MQTDIIRHHLVMGVSHADAELCINLWSVHKIAPKLLQTRRRQTGCCAKPKEAWKKEWPMLNHSLRRTLSGGSPISFIKRKPDMLRYFFRTLVLLWAITFSSVVFAKSNVSILIFGASNYPAEDDVLPNAEEDAKLIKRLFSRMGYNALTYLNADIYETRRGIARFIKSIKSKDIDIAIVYFAGHGVQVDGKNYLLARDAQDIKTLYDIKRYSVEVGQLTEKLVEAGASTSLMFLDACRNNPFFLTAGSQQRGFARIPIDDLPDSANYTPSSDSAYIPRGIGISYSTQPGEFASDGSGRNSPYAKAIYDTISDPLSFNLNIKLSELLAEVEKKVLVQTGGIQRPWSVTRIENDVPLIPDTN